MDNIELSPEQLGGEDLAAQSFANFISIQMNTCAGVIGIRGRKDDDAQAYAAMTFAKRYPDHGEVEASNPTVITVC